MFVAALFTIVKTWEQPKCPATDEWIKMKYMYIQRDTTQPQKEQNAICSNRDGPRDHRTK